MCYKVSPAAREVLEDGVDLRRDVLEGGREGVVALLAHRVEGPGRRLCLLPGSLQLLFPLPFLGLPSRDGRDSVSTPRCLGAVELRSGHHG